jgi:hypothetical protein
MVLYFILTILDFFLSIVYGYEFYTSINMSDNTALLLCILWGFNAILNLICFITEVIDRKRY